MAHAWEEAAATATTTATATAAATVAVTVVVASTGVRGAARTDATADGARQ